MNWQKTDITINGKTYAAIAPLIISASRSTDIPAFYAKEFYNCLNAGYLYWTNPFNGKKSIIDLRKTKFIVFWTKNAKPIFPYLEKTDNMGIGYYFNYTLNDYENEGLETNLPPLKERVSTFKQLSQKIGSEKVIWRFDPLILRKGQTEEDLIERITNIASQIHNFTNKLVISFVDISYRKVCSRLNKMGFELENFNNSRKTKFIKKLYEAINPYGLKIYTCAEQEELDKNYVTKNKCIDDEMICVLSDDMELNEFIDGLRQRNKLKDKGQRKYCACMVSKDIGKYDTCLYKCMYCYARNSTQLTSITDIFK